MWRDKTGFPSTWSCRENYRSTDDDMASPLPEISNASLRISLLYLASQSWKVDAEAVPDIWRKETELLSQAMFQSPSLSEMFSGVFLEEKKYNSKCRNYNKNADHTTYRHLLVWRNSPTANVWLSRIICSFPIYQPPSCPPALLSAHQPAQSISF